MVAITVWINVDAIIKTKEIWDIILDMNVEFHYNINVIIVKWNILINQNWDYMQFENIMYMMIN
jgi:hypothetical protein